MHVLYNVSHRSLTYEAVKGFISGIYTFVQLQPVDYKLFINMERGINGCEICAGSMGVGVAEKFN